MREGALIWLAHYHVLARFADRNPDMVVVRHEDLSADPLPVFGDLYDRLDLRFEDKVRRRIETDTGSHNPGRRRRARSTNSSATVRRRPSSGGPNSMPIVATIRAIAEPLASRWYADDEW